MSRRSAIAVSCYVLLGFILRMTQGTFHPVMVWTLAGVLTSVGYLAFRPGAASKVSERASPAGTLAGVLFASATMLAMNPLLMTADMEQSLGSGTPIAVVRIASYVLAIASGFYCICYFCSVPAPRLAAVACLIVCFVSLFVMRIEAVLATPQPQIDVFVTNSLACEHFLEGRNPYAQTYPDIYEGTKDYQPGFFYWPAYLYVAAPFQALGDIRFAVVAADLITAFFIVVLLKRAGLKGDAVWLAPLAWLACPVSLLVLELGWIDPILVVGSAALAAALASRRMLLVGIAIGFMAATKQYGVLAGIVTLSWVWANERHQFRRVIASAATTFALLLGPFLIVDWRSFYESTVAVYVSVAMRLDALSLLVWVKRMLGLSVNGGVLVAVYLGLVAAACWRLGRQMTVLRDWAGVMAFTYGAIFLLGKLAFCNYYYFAGFWMLLYACFSLLDDKHAQWLAAPKLTDAPDIARAASKEGAVLWST